MARQATDTWVRPPVLGDVPRTVMARLRHSRLGVGVWRKDSPAAATIVFRIQSDQLFGGEEKSGDCG